MPVDPTFEVDDYNRGKILNESQTIAYNILTLLFAKPGFYPSIPSLGMDITSYFYRFSDEDLVNEIKLKLIAQCSDFLPSIESCINSIRYFEGFKLSTSFNPIAISQLFFFSFLSILSSVNFV